MICIPQRKAKPVEAYIFTEAELREFARQHELIGEARERQLWLGKIEEAR
jgi:hypothetical protein